MFRLSSPSDFQALRVLWEDAFHEPADSARFVFEKFCGYNHLYVLEEEGVINAMLCAVPCAIGAARGIYLYGVTTRASQRGRGLTTALMAYAEREAAGQGASFSVLIPQTPDLFAFYERTGYETAFYRRRFAFSFLPRKSVRAAGFQLTPGKILEFRRRYAGSFAVELDPAALAAVTEDLKAQGARGIFLAGGYCIYRAAKGAVVMEELFADTRETAEGLLCAACGAAAAWRIGGYLPEAAPFAFDGEKTLPFGMVKYLAGMEPLEKPYMALMLD